MSISLTVNLFFLLLVKSVFCLLVAFVGLLWMTGTSCDIFLLEEPMNLIGLVPISALSLMGLVAMLVYFFTFSLANIDYKLRRMGDPT